MKAENNEKHHMYLLDRLKGAYVDAGEVEDNFWNKALDVIAGPGVEVRKPSEMTLPVIKEKASPSEDTFERNAKN